MKIDVSLLLVFLSFISVFSQQSLGSQSESNLITIEKKWYLKPTKAIFEDNESPALKAQREARDDLRNPERDRNASPNTPMVKETVNQTVVVYQVKVKNTGNKAVQRIAWSYQFFDSMTDQLLDEKRFGNSITIKPGETKILKVESTQIPLKAFTTKQADKKTRVKPLEKVSFLFISYSDGTTWSKFR